MRSGELGQTEERLALILETIADGILITSSDGRYLFANAAAERILGAPRSRIIDSTRNTRSWKIISIDGKPDSPEERPTLRTLKEGKPVYGTEMVIERADRTTAVLSVSTAILRDSTGIVGVINSLSDITERKRAEEELVRHVKREQEARAEAERAVHTRDEFLSIASHELKTPLTSLQLQVEMLRRSLAREEGPPSAERLVGAVEAVERYTRRFAKLINDLLDVTRIAAGRLTIELEEMDLAALTREVVDRFAVHARGAGCRIAVDASRPIRGRWDANKLEQVVTNLVANAIKYGDAGPIEVVVDSNGETACLSVKDHGIGIEPEQIPAIFDQFARLSSGERRAGGLGLGLYIVRQIAEAHHGTVRVSSTPGAGSRFVVELPLDPDVHAAHAQSEAVTLSASQS